MTTAFEPIRTPRLLLRPPRPQDLPVRLDGAVVQGGPADDDWWMITIADLDDSTVCGHLAVNPSNQMRTAEIGYTLATEHRGKGYAAEAVGALVDWLFEEVGVSRISATSNPDDVASAMVVERLGFRFEGHTRLSCWVGNENSDEWLYGVTPPDRQAWRVRAAGPPEVVELVEIDSANEKAIFELETHRSQRRFVSPVARSFADALFPEEVDGAPVVPWMRGIQVDGAWAGFVMMAVTTEHHPEPYLWRLLIDRNHQRRGIGQRVLDLLVEEFTARGGSTMTVSWTEGRGSPRPFYERYGFEPTGRIVAGETEARLSW